MIYKTSTGKHIDLSKILMIDKVGFASSVCNSDQYGFDIYFQLRDEPIEFVAPSPKIEFTKEDNDGRRYEQMDANKKSAEELRDEILTAWERFKATPE